MEAWTEMYVNRSILVGNADRLTGWGRGCYGASRHAICQIFSREGEHAGEKSPQVLSFAPHGEEN